MQEDSKKSIKNADENLENQQSNLEIDKQNLDFLVIKSRNLLQFQNQSYNSAKQKAAVLISISALFIPIAISYFSSATLPLLQYSTIIPIALMIAALIYLLIVLTSKDINYGMGFDEFDEQLDLDHNTLLINEIGYNKASFNDNIAVIEQKHKHYSTAIRLIVTSTILIFILIFANLITTKENPAKKETTETTIYKTDNQLNKKMMSDQKPKETKQKSRIPDISPNKLVKMKNHKHVGDKTKANTKK